jgi:hypothetical protein
LGNVHLVEVAPGDEVTITVDTANEEYASDFFFLVTDELGGACLAEADDNFECSYPPPSYACPGLVYEVPPWSRGRLYLYVALASDTCTNENRHDYVLRVLVNGCPAPAPSEGDVFDVINIDGW